MKTNVLQMEGLIDIRPIRQAIIEALKKEQVEGSFKDRDICEQETRKHILADIIERFATVNKDGDCLPVGVPISRTKVVSFIVESKEEFEKRPEPEKE